MRYWLAVILFSLPISAVAYVSPGSPVGFVNDFANVISAEAEDELEGMLASYEAQTGIEIAVVTVPQLIDETIETYSVRLFEEWGIGKQGRDNGVLFLAATEDREMRIEVGYGLEGDVTDIEASHLVDVVVPPYFASGDFDGGVRAAMTGIMQAIGVDADLSAFARTTSSSGGSWWGDFFWIFIFGFVWLSSVLSRSRSWWAGGVVGALAGVIAGFAGASWLWLPAMLVAGLVFDYLISTKFKHLFADGHKHSAWPWLFLIGGGPHKWDKGGGFGGFGGGMSGGGGASGRW